jgi:cyanophycinase
MNDLDRFLLEAVGGVASARVALIPAACGQEPGSPARWNQLGVDHFRALGAKVTPLPLISRADAEDPAILAELEGADLFYFSGGSPPYLIDTMQGTPAWEIILKRHRQGAALAGCSAGAIMFGSYTFNHRAVMAGEPVVWRPAIGLLPGLAIIAHFDRFSRRWGPENMRALQESAPPEVTLVGIDEDTALLRSGAGGDAAWTVTGCGSVSLFRPGREPAVFAAGARVPLQDVLRGSHPETADF